MRIEVLKPTVIVTYKSDKTIVLNGDSFEISDEYFIVLLRDKKVALLSREDVKEIFVNNWS